MVSYELNKARKTLGAPVLILIVVEDGLVLDSQNAFAHGKRKMS